MRAVIHHEFGEPSNVLNIEDVATPEPGPGHARVRVVLSPIHNHDVWTIRGTYGFKPEFPARAGTEAVGIVDAIGDGVDNLVVGQRVATGGTFGVWAEYFVAPAAGLIPVLEGVSDETAAQLVSMPFSALALLDSLGLNEGDVMVQNAANGAVGRLVAQLAPSRGIRVVGLVRRAAGVEELAAEGITDVVATDTDGWRERVAEITDGAPIVVGIDSVGGDSTGDVVSLLAQDGRLVVFGAMAAPTMQINSGDVIFKNISITGFWGSRVMKEMPAEHRGVLFGELLSRVADGTVSLGVEKVYSLDEVRAASDANFVAGRKGKVLLRP